MARRLSAKQIEEIQETARLRWNRMVEREEARKARQEQEAQRRRSRIRVV